MQPAFDDIAMPDVDFATAALPDMAERLTALRQEGRRVAPVLYHGRRAYMVLGFDDVARTFQDDVTLPAAVQWNRDFDTGGKTLLHMQGEEHRKFKAAMVPAFSPARVRDLMNTILLPTADELIDQFGEARELDLYMAYNRRYSFLVMSRWLGIEFAQDEEEEWRDLVLGLFQHKNHHLSAEERRISALAAVDKMNARLMPIIERWRAKPAANLISFLVQLEGVGAGEGGRLTDEEVLSQVRQLYLGGVDSTAVSLNNIMSRFLDDSALLARLAADRSLRAPAIEEAIRYYGVTGMIPRYTERNVTVAGFDIPAHSYVLLGVVGANRDERKFDRSDEFQPERKGNQSLTFGLGAHFCLGVHLAREELRISVNRLLDRLPGLRLARPPTPIVNTMLRYTPEVCVKFDKVLPA